jgi:ABC-type transporter Mla subunit MlaD
LICGWNLPDAMTAPSAVTGALRGDAWTGSEADSFFAYVEQIGKAGGHLRDRLTTVADRLDSLQEQLSGLRNRIGDLVYAAKNTIDGVNTAAEAAASKAAAQEDAVGRGVLGVAPPPKSSRMILDEAAQRIPPRPRPRPLISISSPATPTT